MSTAEIIETARMGPNDRVILRVKDITVEEVDRLRSQLDRAGWDSNRVLIVSGIEEMLVVED